MKKIVMPMLVGIGIAFLIMQFIQPTIVLGSSMDPYLKDGDFIFIDKTDKTYERGDVVILINEDKALIKRVIGLPGEKIEYRDKKIYINEKEFEDYVNSPTDHGENITLANDEYYVLGDNRLYSRDSRELGPVKKEDIKGIAVFRLFGKFGKI